ncbi:MULTISPECIES: hypothetical protein [Pelosinus]|uniref:Uncharacterized protein n=1 Tax=Pelosinus fermentans B4 TaxID=1149862 RepID=I8RD38_9FIRM|nr:MULTISPECIES: hypothetical protein [Pelosinus]EIW17118.1 hypothetical protein FB4_4474 [Pelosinus fermentans B4]EIW23083.1 hypothetical protein FA11_4524 [Pelosinus fermentans A11]OAM93875.1 hypothetical protein FR7_01892 [Pelosinus fermentans DSM 17108]SDQ93110.1 hypothetical protein SAMN04515679_1977 [Pelosinus fermentans]
MLIPWEIVAEDSEEARNLVEKLLEAAASDPLILSEIMRGVLHEDPCIQMQAASMVEKVTRVRPLFLTPYRRVLLNEFSRINQPGVRRQVAVLYGRMMWDEWEMKQVVVLLSQWIETQEDEDTAKNSIESLHKLAMQKEWILPIFRECLVKTTEHGNPGISSLANEFLHRM